jgi:hypothetical protein
MEKDFSFFAREFPSFFGPPSPASREKVTRRRRRTAIGVILFLLVPASAALLYSVTPAGTRAQLEAELERIERGERDIAADRTQRAAERAATAVLQRHALSTRDEKTKELLLEVDHVATEWERRLQVSEDEVLRNGRSRGAQILEELRALGTSIRK